MQLFRQFAWPLNLVMLSATSLAQPLDENCTATILNRSVQVSPFGTFAIPNVPTEPGFFRARITCVKDGVTTVGQSGYLMLNASGITQVPAITMGVQDPMPVRLEITSPQTALAAKNQTVQLTATATFADGSTDNVTPASEGTFWSSSNPQIASVGAGGLVTALARGQAIIQANNEGVLAALAINVVIPEDADNDGMTDSFERAYGFDVNDPAEANQDADNDGLTNLEESRLGTNPRAADTDGDGLSDPAEIAGGSNPTRADTDGDGLSDGEEAGLGTDPTRPDTDGDGIPDGLELRLGLDPLVADPTTVVRGRTLDENGDPIAGATAAVFDFLTALSDDDGFFSLAGVPAGQGNLNVLAQLIRDNQVLEGRAENVPPVSGGTTDLGSLTLALNAGVVAGEITDSLGRPVVDAQVTVASGADTRSARTDNAGRYRVDNMTAGDLMVSARDYRTGLRGRSTGMLPLNGTATVHVSLGAFGTVRGTVFGQDGLTPVGPGVQVRLSGSDNQTATTDALGRYLFDFVRLGQFTVEGSDDEGHRGRNSGNLAITGRTVLADITFLGAGDVTGLVFTGSGAPATGVDVTLTSRSVFDGRSTQNTGDSNGFAFDNVFLGTFDVTAVAAASRLAGTATGSIDVDGQSVEVTIQLTSAGSFEGTVFLADGLTAVAGAVVSLSPTGLQDTTDDQGRYRFDFVPLGSYSFGVTDPATGDRGQSTGALAAQDQVETVNINLVGFGAINVLVQDGAGQPVPGARVTASSTGPFPFQQVLAAGSDGRAAFDNFRAGSFAISALNQATGLSGSTSGSVAAGGVANVTVNLQSAGGINGFVLAPEGATPVAGFTVRAIGPSGRTMTSGLDGGFSFANLLLGTYTLQAIDSANRVRASEGGVVLGAEGETVSRNLVISGAVGGGGEILFGGSVEGHVSLADSSSAANVPVTVRSDLGGSFYTRTDVNGDYQVNQVPVGGFIASVNTRVGNNTVFGSTSGSVPDHGSTTTANIQLNSLFDPPSTVRRDANDLYFDMAGDGSVRSGTQNIFVGPGDNRSAALLEVVVDSTVHRFAGDQFGAFEENGLEIVVEQQDLGGLRVLRKVYVPADGYFARFLEILENPSGGPITFDVRLLSNFRFYTRVEGGFTFQREPRIVGTSSGDTLLELSPDRDRWVIIDDDRDGDPFTTATLPPTTAVFDGEGGARQADVAAFAIDFTTRFGRLTEEWQGITLAPGESLAVLHFLSQQSGRVPASASAQRLAQLPPETLVGLSEAERTMIVNFDVPADGVSPLPALPPLTGGISGDVFAFDGAQPVPGARVTFQSDSPYFARPRAFNANSSGHFAFTGSINPGGGSLPVPVDGFNLFAVDPRSGVMSPDTPGDFPPGFVETTQDIVFSNSGAVLGEVRLASGEVVTTGSVTLSGGALLNDLNTPPAGDGSYGFSVVPPGNMTVTASLPIPAGTPLQASAAAVVIPGDATVVDLILPETGQVGGLVRNGAGGPAVNVEVLLQASGFQRAVRTGTGGQYGFTDVPVGDYTVRATEPNTGIPASAPVAVVADTLTSQDLMFIGLGIVDLAANYSSGPPVAGGRVDIQEDARGAQFRIAGNTDLNGRLTIRNVPLGNFALRVYHPANGTLFGEHTGTVDSHGQVVPVVVVVPEDAPPVVALTAPGEGQSFLEGRSIFVAATATDDLGVQRVEFLADDAVVGTDSTSPYGVNFNLPTVSADRPLSLTARAIDTGGNVGVSAPVTIQVLDDTTPPVVSISQPAANSTFLEGDLITILALASDNTSVARVEFSAAGEVLGNDSTAPYQWSYRVPDDFAEAGQTPLTLAARAYDPSGQNAAAEVTVTIDPYNQPAISIADVTLDEGNTGLRDAVFTVQLSQTGTRVVSLDYATADDSATAGEDYVSRSGSLTFNPGDLSKTITVPVIGETVVENDEAFFVNLSNQTNSDLTDGQGVGTITDDDGIPGQLHHFSFATVDSPQFVNQPFPVTVTAQDAFDDPVTDYAGEPALRGLAGDLVEGTMLGNPGHQYSYNSAISVGYAFTPNTDLTVTHVRHYFGTKLSIWTDDGTLVATVNVVSTPGSWRETPLPSPVTLHAGTRYRVAAYSGGGTVHYRTDGPGTFAHGSIHQSHYRSGDTFPSFSDGARWYLVDLRYEVGSNVLLTPTTLAGFVNGVWSGDVTASQPATGLRLIADDGDGHRGDSVPFAVEVRNDVSVAVTDAPDPLGVGDGLSYSILVNNSGPGAATGVALTFDLPPQAAFVSANSTHGTPTENAGQVSCLIGDLTATETATVTVIVRPGSFGSLSALATVTQLSGDTFPDNNTAEVTTCVEGPEADVFRFSQISSSGAMAVEHGGITGDDRSALAVGKQRVLYTGDNGTGSFAVEDLSDGTSVGLTLDSLISDLRTGTLYTLGNGGAPLGQGGTVDSLLPVDEQTGTLLGPVTRDIWTGIGGTAVSDIPLGNPPNVTDRLVNLESPPNYGNNYGARLRARLAPEVSGDYTLWVSGDDNCELWLSTDETPANKALIATVPGWTNLREWNKYGAQKSAPIPLVADEEYYVEALFKEGSGGDHLSVGWARPGEDTTVPSELIPADVLRPFDGTEESFPPPVVFSQSFTANSGSGVYAGYGRVVIHSGSQVYQVTIPDGQVADLGSMAQPQHQGSEGWAYWGVAEHDPDGVSLVYVQNSQTIARTHVPDGATTALATFQNLSDMSVISAAPALDRWYFHHEGTSQFRSGDETIGFADAGFVLGLAGEPDDLSLAVTTQPDQAVVDAPLTYLITVHNTGPSAATAVVVENTLPVGASYGSPTVSQGDASRSGNLLTWTVGQVGPNSDATLEVEIVPNVAGVLANTATVSRGEPDFYLPNNLVQTLTPVMLPTLTISDVAVDEGDSGQTEATFTVGLSAAVNRTVQVQYSTSGSSAQSGVDFQPAGGTLVFDPDVTSLPITVLVEGDALNETDEVFSVFLSNPSSATIADNQGLGTILNDDPQPTVSIADAGLVEPNVGVANLMFEVTLSAPSGLQVRVSYATANDTATAHEDYTPRNGQLIFNAGETVQTLDIPIAGDVLAEPDETFLVNLSSPVNTTVADNQATGTLLDNDSAAGELHHFTFDPVSSPQYAGEPFTVTVTARDSSDNVATAYSGTPSLMATEAGTGGTGNILGNVSPVSTSSGNYTLGYAFTPNTDLTVTHVRHYSGSRVSIWTDAGVPVLSQPVVSTPGVWVETPLASPVILTAGTRYRIAFYTGGDQYNWRTDLPGTFADGTIDQSYEISGDGFPTSADSVRWWFVDLVYRVGEPLAITPESLAGFVNGVWSGPVSIGAPGSEVALRADDGDGHVGDSNPFVVDVRNDLAISGTPNPAEPFVGTEMTYDLTVENSGPNASSEVTVTFTLDPYTYFVSASASQGDPTHDAGVVSCNLGTLNGGASATLSVVVKIAGDGNLSATVQVARTESEFYLANNTAVIESAVPGLDSFQIVTLGTDNVLVTDHNSLTGDDRGGIALSDQNLFYSGDSSTARFPLDTFPNGGGGLGTVYDSLISDLRTGQVYLLGNGSTPIGNGGGTVTSLLELDGATGALTGGSVALSTPITASSGTGLFAGYGRILIHNGTEVFEIGLPGGEVTSLGPMGIPSHRSAENWAFWGVAEHFSDDRWLVYVQDSQNIVRTHIPDGETTTVSTFSSLSDMAAFTVAPGLDRWFFHHEGSSQFGSGSEIVGCANAQFAVSTIGLSDDLLVTVEDSPDPVSVGSPVTYTIQVSNIGPSTATSVQLSDTLPVGVEFGSANSTVGTCQENSGVVTCDLGDLVDGATATITIVITPNDSGVVLENTAMVTRGEPDFYLPNNTAVARTQVLVPTLSIDDLELVEGDDGQTDAVFTVTLSAPTSLTVTATYETSGEDAGEGVDFEYTTGTIEFAPFETTREIRVPVFGDTLYEYDEYFDLYLYDLVNAEDQDTFANCAILNDDNPPTLTISDATITEGNVGGQMMEFEAILSEPSGVWTGIYYETSDDTAMAGQDYQYRSDYIYIEPGDTTAVIQIPVVGDTIPEPDETFLLSVFPDDAEPGDFEAVGTILDDDGTPGQLHHFELAAVNSPQTAGVPFEVTVTALDAFGDPATSFDGAPALRATDSGSGESGNLLGSPTNPNNGNGNYTLGYSFTPNTDLIVTHVRHYFGTKVSIWRDDGTSLTSQPVVSAPGSWQETALSSPVQLQAGSRYRVAAFSNEGPYYWRFDLPNTFPHGTLDQGYEVSGDGFPTNSDSVRWWYVDLVYQVGTPLPVTPDVLSGFIDGVWTGDITIGMAGSEVTLRVNDGDGHVGQSDTFEVLADGSGGDPRLELVGIRFETPVATLAAGSSQPVGSELVVLTCRAPAATGFVVECSTDMMEWRTEPAQVSGLERGVYEVWLVPPSPDCTFFRLREAP